MLSDLPSGTHDSLSASFSLQICNFFIGLYFLSVVNKFGISTVYLGFASVCALAVIYIAGNVVETKGRSLEEIERALSSPSIADASRAGAFLVSDE